MTTSIPSLPLNDGGSIPQIGLGTWPLDDAEVERAIVEAAEHRLPARRHRREVRQRGRRRPRRAQRAGSRARSCSSPPSSTAPTRATTAPSPASTTSLERLGLDYVDLLLIHWPLPARDQFVSTWKTFDRLREAGKARAIGVSNFKPAHIDRLIAETGIVPAVNQIQLSPAIPRREQRRVRRRARHRHRIVEPASAAAATCSPTPVLAALADKHGQTPGQIVLRWHVQNGLVAIPKSRNPERMAENLDVFDFALDADDLAAIDTLDQGPDAGVDSDHTGH